VARRYIAGETLESAVTTVRTLKAESCSATVDLLGEFITGMDQARTTAATYERVVAALRDAGFVPNVSIKLTAFGLLLDENECGALVESLARRTAEAGGFLRIDMEDSPCTDRTLALHDRLRTAGHPVGVVLQARLFRTEEDAGRLAAAGVSVRLCKGIYLEPAAIAHTEYEDIRRAYLRCLRILLEGRGRVAIATHDSVLIHEAKGMIAELEVPRERHEFQMLLGVLPELRRSLVAEDRPVRVYVPFGSDWYAYSTRRLRENPEVAWHVFRAMFTRG
jgi:proline dehydrogenase